MGLTSGAWTDKVVNGRLVLECDLTMAATEVEDAFTLKTPANLLDTTKPWLLFVNTADATVNNATTPVDLWAGWDDAFALTGADAPTATYGAEIASAIMSDVQTTTNTTRVNPYYTGTVVQATATAGGHVNAGTAPYYIINVDGSDTLAAAVCHIAIVQ
ncbi:hypothetical protein LCGC14_0960960 [marine sediment metagenome]|uniref:Uncharacterized protein n=1 Tax=marine sediment metagenome TaxID=412755 RepID=A0A0F9P0M5_9ZZZZ